MPSWTSLPTRLVRRSSRLVPHLASRLVYTGAGGFNSRSPGLEFTLSPRVAHLVANVSDSSTRSRGLFHTKDESLSPDGYHRLHVLSSESLCSELAIWLNGSEILREDGLITHPSGGYARIETYFKNYGNHQSGTILPTGGIVLYRRNMKITDYKTNCQ